jgi:hypothetical protein
LSSILIQSNVTYPAYATELCRHPIECIKNISSHSPVCARGTSSPAATYSRITVKAERTSQRPRSKLNASEGAHLQKRNSASSLSSLRLLHILIILSMSACLRRGPINNDDLSLLNTELDSLGVLCWRWPMGLPRLGLL